MDNPLFSIGEVIWDRIKRVSGTITQRMAHKEKWCYKHTGLPNPDIWVYEDTLGPDGCMYVRD